jgi:1,4-alpha-glucan branching enzyme
MPLAETPSPQGPATLGYNPSLFTTVERDFGSPDDLRQLVNAAHGRSLAVLLDEVFNHTDSGYNPLWQLILLHPDEDGSGRGGLYFDEGTTPWGNHVATWRGIVQEHLIEVCLRAIEEYHVDGFRFDATHHYFMDHGFMRRLAREVKAFKPDTLLVAENLPNEPDLNLQGFDGYAQWCDRSTTSSRSCCVRPAGAATTSATCSTSASRGSPVTRTTSSTTPRATTRTVFRRRSSTR